MKVKMKKEVVFTLDLTEDEARILKSLVQNYHGDIAYEPLESRTLRQELFDSLKELLSDGDK